MDREFLLQRIREAVCRELELPVGDLIDTASLRRDYGLDSVAAVNITFALESELGIPIDIKRLVGVDSIDDLRQLLSQYVSALEG
jgi:acyl carrier protein